MRFFYMQETFLFIFSYTCQVNLYFDFVPIIYKNIHALSQSVLLPIMGGMDNGTGLANNGGRFISSLTKEI